MNTNKDKLEQFIAGNKELFNHHAPSEELKQRIKKAFSKKKQERKVTAKRIQLYKYSAAATVAAATLLLVFYYTNKNEQPGYLPSIVKKDNLPSTNSDENKKGQDLNMPIDTQDQKENQAVITERKHENNEDALPVKVNDEELYHYTRLIEIKQQQIEILRQTAPELYREFASDMKILESSYKELKAQLPQVDDKQQLLETMIDNLKMQAALLAKQLEIYKESRREKQKQGASVG